MDMRELRYFIAVFEECNLTAAAKRSFVSQPSISVAIADLEQELGTTLFIRHKKGVTPTASADDLYPLARRLVERELSHGLVLFECSFGVVCAIGGRCGRAPGAN